MRNAIIELSVISYIIQNKDISILHNLGATHEDFTPERAEQIKFIEDHYKEYKIVPDELTMLHAFGDKYSRVQVKESPLYLETELKTHIAYKKLSDVIQKNAKNLNGSAEEVEEAMHAIKAVVDSETKRGNGSNTGEDIVTSRERLEEYKRKSTGETEHSTLTGIDALDGLLGGILDDDLIAIYARPGVGKSFMLTNLASRLHAQGKNVLFYSGEMEENQVGYRFDSMRSGVSSSALMFGKPMPGGREEYQKYLNYLEELEQQENYFKILTPKNSFGGNLPTVIDLETKVDAVEPDVIIIDQLSLMKDAERAREKRIQVHNIIEALRTMAEVKRIPILVAVQANREATTKNDEGEFEIPHLEHLAEADAVGQFATRAIGIAQKESIDPKTRILKVGITKNRHGARGEFQMTANFDNGVLEEIVQAEDFDAVEQGGDLPF